MRKKSWEQKSFQETSLYLCALMRGALGGEKAPEKPDEISWEDVYTLAKNNSVDGLSFLGVSDLLWPPPMELFKKWRQSYDIGLYRQLGFEEERLQIEKILNHEGISVLYLKGILLTEYYPMPGMRSMADNDILYGFVQEDKRGGYQIRGETQEEQEAFVCQARERLKERMEERGYHIEGEPGDREEDNHDVFIKQPFYNFEFHWDLLPKRSRHYWYYKNPWKKAVRDSQNPFHFQFEPEDEYIFLLLHASKHYEAGGAGFRFLADLYVFLEKRKDSLNWNYIQQELRSLGLPEFEEEMRTLSKAVLGKGGPLGEREKEQVSFLLDRMTYGRGDKEGRNEFLLWKKERNAKSEWEAKWRYALDRIFLPGEMSKRDYPFFYKYRAFKPILIVWRLGKGFFSCPGKFWKEILLLLGIGQ